VYRRKQGLLSSLTNLVTKRWLLFWIAKPNHAKRGQVKGSNHEKLRQLTKNQLHAELIYAESVLLKVRSP